MVGEQGWLGERTALVRKGGILQRQMERKAVLSSKNMRIQKLG